MDSKNVQCAKEKNSKGLQNQELAQEISKPAVDVLLQPHAVTPQSEAKIMPAPEKEANLATLPAESKITTDLGSTVVSELEAGKRLDVPSENFTQMGSEKKSLASQIETRMPSEEDQKKSNSVANLPVVIKIIKEESMIAQTKITEGTKVKIIPEAPENNLALALKPKVMLLLSPTPKSQKEKLTTNGVSNGKKWMSEPRSIVKAQNRIVEEGGITPLKEKQISSTHAVLEDPITESKKLTQAEPMEIIQTPKAKHIENQLEECTKRTDMATKCDSENTVVIQTQMDISNLSRPDNRSTLSLNPEIMIVAEKENRCHFKSQLFVKSESKTRSKIRTSVGPEKERMNLMRLRGHTSKDLKRRKISKSKSDSKRFIKKRRMPRSRRKKKVNTTN